MVDLNKGLKKSISAPRKKIEEEYIGGTLGSRPKLSKLREWATKAALSKTNYEIPLKYDEETRFLIIKEAIHCFERYEDMHMHAGNESTPLEERAKEMLNASEWDFSGLSIYSMSCILAKIEELSPTQKSTLDKMSMHDLKKYAPRFPEYTVWNREHMMQLTHAQRQKIMYKVISHYEKVRNPSAQTFVPEPKDSDSSSDSDSDSDSSSDSDSDSKSEKPVAEKDDSESEEDDADEDEPDDSESEEDDADEDESDETSNDTPDMSEPEEVEVVDEEANLDNLEKDDVEPVPESGGSCCKKAALHKKMNSLYKKMKSSLHRTYHKSLKKISALKNNTTRRKRS
jgi:hypothetical protein